MLIVTITRIKHVVDFQSGCSTVLKIHRSSSLHHVTLRFEICVSLVYLSALLNDLP